MIKRPKNFWNEWGAGNAGPLKYAIQQKTGKKTGKTENLFISFSFHLFSFLIPVFIAVVQFVGAQIGKECGTEEFTRCAEPFEMLHLSSEFSYAAVEKEELDKLCQYVSFFVIKKNLLSFVASSLFYFLFFLHELEFSRSWVGRRMIDYSALLGFNRVAFGEGVLIGVWNLNHLIQNTKS